MNTNNNNFRADQYFLYYEQHQLLQSAAPSVNTGVMTSSSEFNFITCDAEMCEAARRRRSSKGSGRRTMPTTILNANPSNFRALVQKFTGRRTNTDVSVRRKGPVTLDFRSPASVSKEVIFPSSGGIQNYDHAIDSHVGDGESHVTMAREGKETASYQMGQLSDCGHFAHGHHDNHDDGDGDDLVREYMENSSFNGVDYMDYDGFYHNALLLEEFMMRDLDI